MEIACAQWRYNMEADIPRLELWPEAEARDRINVETQWLQFDPGKRSRILATFFNLEKKTITFTRCFLEIAVLCTIF